jgi:hypothetical protein
MPLLKNEKSLGGEPSDFRFLPPSRTQSKRRRRVEMTTRRAHTRRFTLWSTVHNKEFVCALTLLYTIFITK